MNFWSKKADVKRVISLKNYGPARTKKEWALAMNKPYDDNDKDKLMNWYDCKPSKKKHREPMPGDAPAQAKAREAKTGGYQ